MITRGRTPLTLLIAGLLAFTAVGCGVKQKDVDTSSGPDVTVTTPTTAKTDTPDTTAPDETTEADSPDETTEPDSPDTTEPSSDTTLPAGVEDQVKEQMKVGFKQLGLTDEQADCLADAYLQEFGTGASTTPDYTKILDLFAGCDIDPSKIGTGG